MVPPSIASTYGAWLIALFIETMQVLPHRTTLYGIGIVQTVLYFQWSTEDGWTIKVPVTIVFLLETTQIMFFFSATYSRFIQEFGVPLGDLIWTDSVQLLANYLSAFTVQIYFATRIHRLTRAQVMFKNSAIGIYVVVVLALTGIAAGITQVILTYKVHEYAKLEQTKAITTLQTAASVACDIVITLYLCIFLARNKGGMPRCDRENVELTHDERREPWGSDRPHVRVYYDLVFGISWDPLVLPLDCPQYVHEFYASDASISPHPAESLLTQTNRLNMRHHFQRKIISNEQYSVNLEDIPVSTVEFVHPIGTVDSDASSLPAKMSAVSTATLHNQTN
ncbi:hypothetical protein B0H16DRAFT_1715641 [Mycena metata]|uniref:Uncharacterized protein n=1 Tax=Mycena metata TaxID=1033252 RepID=A0AAD7JQV8_9AGAR|nr:hypothetical protein B0H16DRAFT_1715641 [Mycena metata]